MFVSIVMQLNISPSFNRFDVSFVVLKYRNSKLFDLLFFKILTSQLLLILLFKEFYS